MVDKKKILFFMWSFSLGGGAEKILSTIVSNLDPKKYDIDILEIEHFDKGYEPVPDNVRILKALQDYRQPRWLRALLWRLRIYFPRLTRRLLVKDQYDVEVSFTIMNPPLLFSKRKEVKKISWIHGSIEEFLTDSSKRESHKRQLDAADRMVGISKKTSYSIKEVFPEYSKKLITVYNGYNFESILKKSREKIDIEIEPQSICTIGRIEENKGSDRVVEVIRLLHQQGKKYHLYFIGAGDMEEELKKKVQAYQLEDYIHFLGYQKNPYQYLSHMKVLLSMSKQEGFPGVYVEALSLGISFVSTEVGGAEELSQEGRFGKIVESNQEAAQEIENYMTAASNFDANEASKFIQQFTIAKQIEQVEKLIEE
ncbi:glycosyltransferase [Streptococcus peroris]|uniref:glycosyltransferase n=1 Tax=Streptococcus peroris TaxID=68891 RepID=UPI0039C11FFB